ncbi:MAG: aldose 1-epimerase [Caulobacteraceae bacterium]|nr:aldose 1-epimerase [Caulobacteraceae bacterium]
MAAVVLTAEAPGPGPRFTSASFLPERGLMLERLTASLPGRGSFDIVDDSTRAGDDSFGNAAFSFGGAFLVPFANRVRGRPVAHGLIETEIAGKRVRLPANWGGKAAGAERYAMHGLILDKPAEVIAQAPDRLRGVLRAGDFGVGWPSSTDLKFDFRLEPTRLTVEVAATNVGDERTPVGIGWHPYFHLPSGDRSQARLRVAAERRLEVDDYDAVLPTGRALPVVGTPYDFAADGGRALGGVYLDDCFVDLRPNARDLVVIADPAGGMTLTLSARAPVKAVQVYAPPDKAFVVAEPQFNWANPFGPEWPEGTDTGMAWLEPGERVAYSVSLTLSD